MIANESKDKRQNDTEASVNIILYSSCFDIARHVTQEYWISVLLGRYEYLYTYWKLYYYKQTRLQLLICMSITATHTLHFFY